jgi:dipeptidyl aminopeptidase/acylaminoacyl peptidase
MIFVLRLAGLIFVAYLAVLALMWAGQTRLVFLRPRAVVPDPQRFGYPSGRRITAVTEDQVELQGWFIPPGGSAPGPALIFFYGNGETVATLASVIDQLRPPGMGFLVIDYRGYGENGGRSSEAGLYRDAAAAWDAMVAQPEIDSSRIAVYGRSLGTAAALSLALARPVAAVVLEAPFTNARGLARAHYPFVPPFLIRLSLDNAHRAERLEAPLLVIHGTRDEVVPFSMGEEIARLGRAREFAVIEGASHNDLHLVGGREVLTTIERFLKQAGMADAR